MFSGNFSLYTFLLPNQEFPKWASPNQEFLEWASPDQEFPKVYSSPSVCIVVLVWMHEFLIEKENF